MDIIGFLKEWMWVLNFVPALLLFIGVPAFIVVRRRRLARMSPLQRAAHIAEERRWNEWMIDPANLSSPSCPHWHGHRDD